jgi:hypothetical protein
VPEPFCWTVDCSRKRGGPVLFWVVLNSLAVRKYRWFRLKGLSRLFCCGLHSCSCSLCFHSRNSEHLVPYAERAEFRQTQMGLLCLTRWISASLFLSSPIASLTGTIDLTAHVLSTATATFFLLCFSFLCFLLLFSLLTLTFLSLLTHGRKLVLILRFDRPVF